MFTKIIVGVDGSSGGEDAFAFARSIAGDSTEIVLVTTMAFDLTMPTRRRILREMPIEEDDLPGLEGRAMLRELAGADGHVELVIRPNIPAAQALHEEAERTHADLIVVGCTHHGAPGRLVFGDMSRAALHGAPCPVAVVPTDFRNRGAHVRVVAVACDDSAEARDAVAYAASAAEAIGARLHLVTVAGVPSALSATYSYTYAWEEIVGDQRASAERLLASLATELPEQTTSELLDGPIGPSLEDLSRRVDAIVAGSRGWGTARSVVFGSTTDRLIHHAACPVIVVPRPREEGERRTPEHVAASAGTP